MDCGEEEPSATVYDLRLQAIVLPTMLYASRSAYSRYEVDALSLVQITRWAYKKITSLRHETYEQRLNAQLLMSV